MPEISAPPTPRQVYEFGDFQLDPTKRLLSRRNDATAVPLTPRVFDTLLFLVQHAHTVLDKERLMEAVWPDSIVEENNLSQNISTLRRVLGDKPGANRYIATVPGRGYRFVADVVSVELGGPEPADAEASPQPAEITPPAKAAPPATEVRRPFARALLPAGAVALLALFAFLAWWHLRPRPTESFPQEKGIAVLPFENLSPEGDESFFADGIQDDILTSIGKIRDLKVIARASVMDYRGPRRARQVREIGRALGVTHVLEGSVRRVGGRVVVSVALIDTRDERQVWSERYERSLTDTLSLQGELAVEIARALRATVSATETSTVGQKPTADPDAYLLYLRGRNVQLGKTADWARAAKLYEEAATRDPAFAVAHAHLAIAASELSYAGDSTTDWRAKARTHAAEAVRLQPNLGEAHLALTYHSLMIDRDHERAATHLARATELLPNSADVSLTAAFIYKLQNRYADRIAALRRAEVLDPRNLRVLSTLARTLRWVRDWRGAIETADRIAVLRNEAPAAARLWWLRANDEFRLTGNIDVLERALAAETKLSPPLAPESLARSRYEIAMLKRDYAAAADVLAEFAPGLPAGSEFTSLSPHTKLFLEALLHVARGDDAATTAQALTAAAAEIEQLLAESARVDVRKSALQAELALLYAFLGRQSEAIAAAERAIDLEGGSSSNVEENARAAALALVYARTGETEKALDLIEHLLTVPCELQSGEIYNMTLTDLRMRWVWDPLRARPRFQKLLAGEEPRTLY